VTGIDIVPDIVERHAACTPAIRWLCGSLQDAGFTTRLEQYDLVFLLEVLQYVPLAGTLEALWPHLAPGGRLIGVVPNKNCPIAARTRARFGPCYDPATVSQIEAAIDALPEAAVSAIRGLFFRDDQSVGPYDVSPWGTQARWTAPPNRLQFVVLRRG
jgi:SAM-dependent methyltransferase